MKIAIVGTGIAGSVVAYRLREQHDITVFEANDYVGGHTNTVDVRLGGREHAVDTGFIVFNDWTYPNFIALLAELGVASKPTAMSFSVQCERTGLEYNGTTINSLFAQRRNLLRPSFYRMIRDILRFNREAPQVFARDDDATTIGSYLTEQRYSSEFIDHYMVPMCAAIWSAEPRTIAEAPARFLIRFLENHGLLSIDDRPIWRVIKGGSRSYMDRLIAGHRPRIRLSCPVERIARRAGGVDIKARGMETEQYDRVFLACHSDQALKLLTDVTPLERRVLGAIPYQRNEAVLHTDGRLLPKRRLARAAWNYHIPRERQSRAAVTYSMNILQGLDSPEELCVTLNNSDKIRPEKIIKRITYDHPMFTRDSVTAQRQHEDVNGVNGTYYCGAYWRNGFHEDGVVSAQSALRQFEDRLRHEELHLRRAG